MPDARSASRMRSCARSSMRLWQTCAHCTRRTEMGSARSLDKIRENPRSKIKTPPTHWVRGDQVCHARRHWNSTSYRSAAGIYCLGEKYTSFRPKCYWSGAEGDRTPDLCSAIAALSQLSYSPVRGVVNLVGKSASIKLTTQHLGE